MLKEINKILLLYVSLIFCKKKKKQTNCRDIYQMMFIINNLSNIQLI